MAGESESIQYVKAWQCIGCGKIETPQPCVGICQDRKVEFVYRFEHEEVLAQLEAARRRLNALESIARRLAWTKPRDNEWEHSFRVLQDQVRALGLNRSGTEGVERPTSAATGPAAA